MTTKVEAEVTLKGRQMLDNCRKKLDKILRDSGCICGTATVVGAPTWYIYRQVPTPEQERALRMAGKKKGSWNWGWYNSPAKKFPRKTQDAIANALGVGIGPFHSWECPDPVTYCRGMTVELECRTIVDSKGNTAMFWDGGFAGRHHNEYKFHVDVALELFKLLPASSYKPVKVLSTGAQPKTGSRVALFGNWPPIEPWRYDVADFPASRRLPHADSIRSTARAFSVT